MAFGTRHLALVEAEAVVDLVADLEVVRVVVEVGVGDLGVGRGHGSPQTSSGRSVKRTLHSE
jgi:hypothetical protein